MSISYHIKVFISGQLNRQMKFLILLLLTLSSFVSLSQTKLLSIKLTDSATKQPIINATVELKKVSDKNVFLKMENFKEGYSFRKVESGKYNIKVTAIGYNTFFKLIEIAESDTATVTLDINLTSSVTSLSEVNISTQKQVVKREIDRLVYNVSEDKDSQSLSLLELLRKVPMVSIDGDRNIRVKGSSNFRVFINDKPSALFSRNIADALRSIPASTILRIEIITSPPPKYDAEGVGGIINIITQRKSNDLYNIRFGLKYTSPDGPSGNSSFAYAKDKFVFSVNGGVSQIKSPETTSGLTRVSTINQTHFYQQSLDRSKNNFVYGQFSSSYQIDTLKLLTLSGSLNGNNGNNQTKQFSRLLSAENKNIDSYNLQYNDINSAISYGINANYELKFARKPENILTFSYSYLKGDDELTDDSRQEDSLSITKYNQFNKSGRSEHSLQTDFVYPVNRVKIETGVKAIFRKNYSHFWSQKESNYIENDFNYDQNVVSFYNSYLFTTKSTDIKAGFRVEMTDVHMDMLSDNPNFKPYYNFIPAISIQQKIAGAQSITLGYTKRLERPGIWELNPFVNNIDPRNTSFGNPFLKASISNNFEVFYNSPGKVSLDLGADYVFSKGNIEIANTYDALNNVYATTYQNGSKKKKWGGNVSLSYSPSKTTSVNVNSSVTYENISGELNNNNYTNSGTTYNIYGSVSKRFLSGFRVNLSSSYNNGIVLLQGRTSSILIYSASVNKAFLSNKLNVFGSLTNPFTKYRYLENNQFTFDSYQVSRNQRIARQFSVGINYKIGKPKSVKETDKTISNDDVKAH